MRWLVISAARSGAGSAPDPEGALLVTQKGTALNEHTARGAFHQMVQHAGLPARAGAGPRLHDFRHTFATQTMIDAYRYGRDPARTLTLLSVWLDTPTRPTRMVFAGSTGDRRGRGPTT